MTKNLYFFLLLVTASNLLSAQVQYAPEQQKPNIILIVADDLGWKDLAFMGSRFYNTPNLDKFASQGMTFMTAYTGAANCAPSRACLMTGQNTPRHGIYTVGSSARGEDDTRKLIPIKNTDVLADSFVTLAETLRKEGYVTCNIGKWHLGSDPKTQGFDFNVAGTDQGAPPSYFSPYKIPAIQDGPKGEYLTDRLTTEANKFLEDHKSEPFFLYLPFYAVHTPLQAPDSLVAKYANRDEQPGQSNAKYGAMVESLDWNLGRLFKKLDELNLTKNTIVIFTSDNGGVRAISAQDPLRSGKGSYYEGGLRVPLIVRWPGEVKENSIATTPVSNLDFYPTIMDILHMPTGNLRLDGESFLPVLKGRKLSKRTFYWHFPIYLQAYDYVKDNSRDPVFRTRPGSSIRQGDWKLIKYYEDGALELYNLKDDLSEKVNLAFSKSRKAKKLNQKLQNWLTETNAPIPTEINPRFNPARQFVPPTLRKGKPDDEG